MCGAPQHPDLEKIDLGCSKVVYVFQAIFLLFTMAAVSAFKLGLIGSALILLSVWWVGLGIFAAQPVGGQFLFERQLANNLIESRRSKNGKHAARAIFFVLYWPIFISKNVYFWSILVAVGIYYALKFFYSK